MENYVFQRGNFITIDGIKGLFAIWDGNSYTETQKDGSRKTSYELIAYYEPNYKEANGEIHNKLAVGVDGDFCNFIISEEDLSDWSPCSQEQINEALKVLAENGYKFDEINSEIQPLKAGEKIYFGNPNDKNAPTPSATTHTSIWEDNSNKNTILKKKWNRQHISLKGMTFDLKKKIKSACNRFNIDKYNPTVKTTYVDGQGSYPPRNAFPLVACLNGGVSGRQLADLVRTAGNQFDYDEDDVCYWD